MFAPGRLEDVEPDAGPAVQVTPDREFRRDQADVCEVMQAHVAGHDEVADVVDGAELADRPHQEALRAARDLARADREVRAFERVAQARDVDAVGGDAHRVDEDAQLEGLDALERDARHAVEALERLLQVAVERVVLPRQVLLARDPDRHDPVVPGGEHLRQDPVGARRELVADRFELGADLEPDCGRVPVPLEEDDELGAGLGGGGADLLDARERRDRLLGGARDELLDLLGRRAGVGDRDLDAREADVREQLERQQAHRDDADQRERDEGHQRRDRPPEREARVDHGSAPGVLCRDSRARSCRRRLEALAVEQ